MNKDTDHQNDDATPRKSTKPKKAQALPKNTPYKVGRGKPPKANQFKPGNKLGGRKPGSKNINPYQKLLDEKVTIGRDRLGRAIRRSWRKLIDQQLLKQAVEGNLAAIKLSKEFDLKTAALQRSSAGPMPTIEALRQEARDIDDREKTTAKLVQSYGQILDFASDMKKVGMVTIDEDGIRFTPNGLLILKKATEEGALRPG